MFCFFFFKIRIKSVFETVLFSIGELGSRILGADYEWFKNVFTFAYPWAHGHCFLIQVEKIPYLVYISEYDRSDFFRPDDDPKAADSYEFRI